MMQDKEEVIAAIHALEVNMLDRMHTHTVALQLNSQRVENLTAQVSKQHNALFGTHYEDDPGLLTQMGEMQKTDRESKWTVRTVLASFLVVIGNWCYEFFTNV